MGFVVRTLVLGLVAMGALTVLAVAGFFVARHVLRRHWSSLRRHVLIRGLLAGFSFVAAWREGALSSRSVEELSEGSPSRVRRRMWVAIEDAEAAVEHAVALDAPVAELPSVCRSLRHAGDELDRLLRLERRLPRRLGEAGSVRSQVADVMRASRHVQLAALTAGGDVQASRVSALTRDAREEADIVAAAVERLRTLAPRRT